MNTWTEEMASQWLERKVSKVYEVRTADKRKEDNPEWMSSIPVKQAKKHKKFEVVKEGWDEGTLVVVDGVEPYLPLPQRVGGRLRGGRSSTHRTSRPPGKLTGRKIHTFFNRTGQAGRRGGGREAAVRKTPRRTEELGGVDLTRRR